MNCFVRNGSMALALLVMAGAAQAENFDLNVGSHAVGVGVDGPMGRVYTGTQGEYEVGGLFHSQSNADYNEGYVGIKVTGNTGVTTADVNGGLGLRGVYADGENGNGESVALAGNLDLRLHGLNRFVFTIDGAYSPDPLSFGDVKEYTRIDLTAGYELLRKARLYVGYRNVGVDFGDGRHTVDNGFMGGVRLSF